MSRISSKRYVQTILRYIAFSLPHFFSNFGRGLHVIATARDFSVLADLAAVGITTIQLDVTDSTSIEKCHQIVSDLTSGRLDILINNA